MAELDPDLIKIDRELIRKGPVSKTHRSICAGLVAVARDSDKLVLAEGVETAEERDLMAHLGVDLYQGYLFAKPAPYLQDPTALAALPMSA